MRFLTHLSVATWLRLALFNLLLVGCLGLLMRLKVIFPLPWLNQQYVLHAHSHFAFGGWVTHTLMLLMFVVMCPWSREGAHLHTVARTLIPAQNRLIWANLLTAYGMLGTFLWQGYGAFSITAATLGLVVSYWFSVYVWRSPDHSHALDPLTRRWFRAAVIFLVLSSGGTFMLSYLMVNKQGDLRIQLAAVYFYLHFQYNGWFLFACFGLLQQWLARRGIRIPFSRNLFRVFLFACLPTYLLSVLWMQMPDWLYAVLVITTLAQLTAWAVWFTNLITHRGQLKKYLSPFVRFLLMIVGIAFSVKLVLQALSLIPELSRFAYGFRPIVIAYLHLILLVVVSAFLLAYAFGNGLLKTPLSVRISTVIFLVGVFFNEILLALQGALGMLRVFINYIPQSLAVAAFLICAGLIGMLLGQFIPRSKS